MHLAPGSRGRELAAGNDAQVQAVAGDKRGGKTGEGVVVGEGDRGKAGARRAIHHRFGSEAPVGSGGVHVQVDGGSGRFGSRRQRRYPISGAVHEGCEWASRSRSSASLNWASESSRLLAPSGE